MEHTHFDQIAELKAKLDYALTTMQSLEKICSQRPNSPCQQLLYIVAQAARHLEQK